MYGFVCDPWKIIQTRLDPGQNRVAESLFTLGNEYMGLRGFFEERYSGDTLSGVYVGGIHYPDKSMAARCKNGYPAHFARVPNSINWAGLNIQINGRQVDLARHIPLSFRRELDMKTGSLTRHVIVEIGEGNRIGLAFQRFLSMDDRHVAYVSAAITPLAGDIYVEVESYLDGDSCNQCTGDADAFWSIEQNTTHDAYTYLAAKTEKTGFLLGVAQSVRAQKDGEALPVANKIIRSAKGRNGHGIRADVAKDSTLTIEKYIAVYTSRDMAPEAIAQAAIGKAQAARDAGHDTLYGRHMDAMAGRWERLDIQIRGDDLSQQGIRYNIFQLFQTYYGYDPDLNVGPRGYSGERCGGVAYWDTEAFCFPFYLYNDSAIALDLLLYRYRHLDKAKENAGNLGLKGALYPMITISGEECHDEWEILFEGIHRNGAIAYAIYHYTRYTGDDSYLMELGVEVLIELCRFWASRVSFSSSRNQYVILGVTGPNEYENNVNNNWYTNTMAAWTLEYTLDVLTVLRESTPGRIAELGVADKEIAAWRTIAEKMYFPYDAFHRVFEQQDLFCDKELIPASSIKSTERPLRKHWSWDRILRSCFIKQADVLQGLYFFPEKYDLATQKRNFLFYEPMTVHESSLSASIHSIIASRVGLGERAYELYLRTSRLDLEDINKDTDEGIHLTGMAGGWNTVVQGFAGLDFTGDRLSFSPSLPPRWVEYSFQIVYRGTALRVTINQSGVGLRRLSGPEIQVVIQGPEQKSEIRRV